MNKEEKPVKEKPEEKKEVKTHVSEKKKERVKILAELMGKKTVMVVSIKGLPSAQFQDIKKKLRGKATIQVAKKSLVDFALDHCGIKELHQLVPFVQDSTAILFSDSDAFEISGIISEEKTPAKAKEGQESPEDIEVKAGPTDLLPGPDISALSAVGLKPKVEGGKIAIVQDAILVKKGESINAAKVAILAKLDITPFEVGLEPIAAYMDGQVYKDIKIDKEKAVEELQEAFSRGLAFAVSVDYVNKDTLTFVLGKAAAHESAISGLVKEDKKEEEKIEEKPVDEAKPEDKKEEVPTADELAKKKEDETQETKSEEKEK